MACSVRIRQGHVWALGPPAAPAQCASDPGVHTKHKRPWDKEAVGQAFLKLHRCLSLPASGPHLTLGFRLNKTGHTGCMTHAMSQSFVGAEFRADHMPSSLQAGWSEAPNSLWHPFPGSYFTHFIFQPWLFYVHLHILNY